MMGLNKEAIERHLKYLKEDRYDREFYVALLLYDIKGVYGIQDLTDKDIDRAYEIQDRYDSIYNGDMRDSFLYEYELESEQKSRNEEIERDL